MNPDHSAGCSAHTYPARKTRAVVFERLAGECTCW